MCCTNNQIFDAFRLWSMPLLIAFAVSACATKEITPETFAYQSQLGTVAIVAADQPPELKFDGFVRSKGEGALVGGGETFAACVSNLGSRGCSGNMCAAGLLILLGICGVSGVVGGVVGAVVAPSADQVVQDELVLTQAFEVRTIQSSLRNTVVDAALLTGVQFASPPEDKERDAIATHDYRSLVPYGINSVLETTLTKVGTSGSGLNDPLAAYMQVHVRVIDTTNNVERYTADYTYQGRSLTLAAWSANRGKPLLDELSNGYASLGKLVAENVFLLYPYPDRSRHSAGEMMSSSFGLAPIYPPTRGALTGDRGLGGLFEWYAVENLSPQLKWEAFPRADDMAQAPAEMARVRNVRYDLIVAKEENMLPGEVVFRREGLVSPSHTIGSLQSGKRYFWTVRARFDLDGRPRVTEWSSTHFVAREQVTAPSRYSYRFRTP